MSKTEISLDGEWLLERIEAIEHEINEIRRVSAMGAAPVPSPQGVDLTQIEWLKKGSEPASVSDSWAWAFAYNQDGTYKPESKTLVQTIEQYGEFLIDGYKMTLAGHDGKLLNRKKVKAKGRGQ